MKLEELIPENPIFHLKKTGSSYELRPPNLEDRVMITRISGGDDLKKIFEEARWDDICRIIYRLMLDKSDFLASKESSVDDNGFLVERMVDGPTKLMRAVTSQDESNKMVGALIAAITAGEPQVREYIQNEVKKNQDRMDQMSGEKSSTSSPPSMDTQLSSSES